MRRMLFVFALAVATSVIVASDVAAQVPAASGDTRVLMALTDSLVLCEAQARFPRIEVAWKSDDPAPSDDPPDIRWSSVADSIATIKSNSQVTGRKAGVTHIIATVHWGSVTASKPFPVTILAGRFDAAASEAEDRLVCRE